MKISEAIKSLLQTGGFTLSVDNILNPRKGFSIAKAKANEFVVKLSKFEKLGLYAEIESYCEKHEAALNEKDSFLGGWIEDGLLFLDIVELVTDRDTAIKLAKERDQLAIFDNASCQVIYTNSRAVTA